MKITDLKVTIFEREHRPHGAVANFTGPVPRRTSVLLVRVLTDQGIEGVCGSFFADKGIVENLETSLKPLILARDPAYREQVWQEFWRLSRVIWPHQFSQGLVDTALWDLAAKAANLPLYKFLGALRDKAPAYASSHTLRTPEDYGPQAEAARGQGFTAYKLHPFGQARKDVDACMAARKAVGDGMALMSDPVAAYTRQEAMWVGRALEELGFEWLEEPLPDWDIEGYVQLSAGLDLPIAGTEMAPGNIFSTAEYVRRKAVDIVRSDALFKQGVTALKKTASLCEAFSMPCEVHSVGGPWISAASLHVICSIPNCKYYECFYPPESYKVGVVEDIKIDNEGYAHAPQKPGLGLDLDWDWIKKHTLYES